MHPQRLVEFTWEGKTREEVVHFLTPPVPVPEWTDVWPNKAALRKMHRTQKSRAFKIAELVYKVEPTYGFLAGIQLKFTNGWKTPMFQCRDAEEQGWEAKTVKSSNPE